MKRQWGYIQKSLNEQNILIRNCNIHQIKASGIPIPFIAVSFTNIEVIRQNVFSHARDMVIGVRSDLKCHQLLAFFSFITIVGILTFMSM